MKKLIGIFGGAFDPVHVGHVGVAEFVLKSLPLKEIRFIPCFSPPHREQPIASFDDRVSMLRMAAPFVIDDRERGAIPSYAINTLKSLRTEFPTSPLGLMMGIDQFAHIESWYHWEELLDYCHFIIINRPDIAVTLSQEAKNLLKQHETKNKNDLQQALNGKIIQLEMPPIPISSTQVREKLKHHQALTTEISSEVYQYIKQHRLYGSVTESMEKQLFVPF